MRRIGRYILNALTLLSLVLCVVICALCIRSFLVSDHFGEITQFNGMRNWETADETIVEILDGRISYLRWRCIDTTSPRRRRGFTEIGSNPEHWGDLGSRAWFGVIVEHGGGPVTINKRNVSAQKGIFVVVPLWLPAIVTSIPPIVWICKRRRRTTARRAFEVRPSGAADRR